MLSVSIYPLLKFLPIRAEAEGWFPGVCSHCSHTDFSCSLKLQPLGRRDFLTRDVTRSGHVVMAMGNSHESSIVGEGEETQLSSVSALLKFCL